MKKKALVFLIFLASISFLQMDCKDEPPVKPDPPKKAMIALIVISVQEQSAQLKLTINMVPLYCKLLRDTTTIFTGIIAQQETLITDANLFSGEQYSYIGYIISDGLKKDSSEIVQITTPEPDSTSHEFIWEIDTLGSWQSAATDVWGTSPTNVYVAGFFYYSDTGSAGTNIMHWNGQKWNPENFYEGDMYAIYGFSANDIWVGGSNGVDIVIGHWDGQKWNKTELGNGQITGLWGTASNNIFATLGSGKILHYDGSNWMQMETGTNIYLSDIWGLSRNAIYACGYNGSTGYGVLLFFDGIQWDKLYERNFTTPIEPYGQTLTVWGYDTSHVYIRTSSGVYVGNLYGWNNVDALADKTFVEQIKGGSYKNIFMVGHFGFISHWNGKSWYRYEKFYHVAEGTGDILQGVWAKQKQVFAVGRSTNAKGIIYRGKQ
jgi:hypothetical protein